MLWVGKRFTQPGSVAYEDLKAAVQKAAVS